MTVDRTRFVAFVAAGALWMLAGAGLWPGWWVVGLGVTAVYVLVGSLALARVPRQHGRTVLLLWAAALVATASPLLLVDGGVGWAVFLGVVVSVLVGAWIATGTMLVHFMTGESGGPAPLRGRPSR